MHPLPIQSLPAQRIPPLPAAAMLRSQRIPTRLEVGYMGDVYHAWISIYTKETGWVNGIIEFDGKNWELMDPTFASSSKSPKNFTSKNSKYTTNFDKTGDDDFSFAIPGVSRFRVSTFKQRGSYSAVIRVISFTLPQPSELHIPDAVMNLADSRRGMVLVTGPAGSGKSTTLACLIDRSSFLFYTRFSVIRSSWLYFAVRSPLQGAPVLIQPALTATARSAINASSVSPERCEITAL